MLSHLFNLSASKIFKNFLLAIYIFFIVILLITLWSDKTFADPKLPGFFTENMVFQRNKNVPIWGWAEPGENVTIEFSDQKISTKADINGNWFVQLAPMNATVEGKTLKVGSSIKLNNIVVGDVWICSGQSNMAFYLCDVINSRKETQAANFSLIRHIEIERTVSDIPQNNANGSWKICTPENSTKFTAVGYFFAKKIHEELKIPIGLINVSWGGTFIEPWIPPEGFKMIPELKSIAERIEKDTPTSLPQKESFYETWNRALVDVKRWIPEVEHAIDEDRLPPALPDVLSICTTNQDPTKIYNAMVHPIIPFAIRGVIWYQGEANSGIEGKYYFQKMCALIKGWRKLWEQGDFPFYFVQIANFQEPNDSPECDEGWSRVRDAQKKSLAIKNTGMAVTIDIGEENDIHPKNKQDVGLRLALWALAKEYGQKDIVYSGPLYRGYKIDNDRIIIKFDHIGSGLMVGEKNGIAPTTEVPNGELQRFAIAGLDKKWLWADAKINNDKVIVSSKNVPNPVAVRYAFSINPQGCNLYNREGLPASPFRTDDW